MTKRSKYEEPCPACGDMVHPVDEESHLDECWPKQLSEARDRARTAETRRTQLQQALVRIASEGCAEVGGNWVCMGSGYPLEDWCAPCQAKHALDDDPEVMKR